MGIRKAISAWLSFIDDILSDDFEPQRASVEYRFKCSPAPARITYYNSSTRPRSRQRGEGVEATRSAVNGCF
jgi:hypothetical protein